MENARELELIEKREKDIEYVLEQPELVALVDERQYIYGNLIVKLKEISSDFANALSSLIYQYLFSIFLLSFRIIFHIVLALD